jgi:quercetin dioxygenase-like cupin family protein
MAKEREMWKKGNRKASYYQKYLEDSQKNPLGQTGSGEMKKIIRPEEMPWENSKHGRIKHMINQKMAEKMNVPAKSVDLYMQEIPPGGRSGKHRHMSEECVYIIEGKGYDMHWDVDIELQEEYKWTISDKGEKHEWEAGDVVYIPINTVHQHFNSDPDKPARIISAVNRVYNHLGYGYNDLEQLEDAPEYKK